MRVVLQLPRGNLEVVQPRALVLLAVAQALQAGQYDTAWDLAANNRCGNVATSMTADMFPGMAVAQALRVGQYDTEWDLAANNRCGNVAVCMAAGTASNSRFDLVTDVWPPTRSVAMWLPE